jgi:hypothetical protein
MKLKWGRAPGRMTNGRMTMMSGHCRGVDGAAATHENPLSPELQAALSDDAPSQRELENA